MSKSNLTEVVKAARRVSTPLLAVSTADQPALVAHLKDAINGGAPKVAWDCMRAFRALNEAGKHVLAKISKDDMEAMVQPEMALQAAMKFAEETVLFMLNLHLFFDRPAVVQGVANLRDEFKADRRTLVLLGPGGTLPAVLQSDVVTLDEPLPDDDALGGILDALYEDAKLGKVEKGVRPKAVAAGRGLSKFGAEQVYAMSLTKDGINLEDAWERKKAAVNQTPGLSLTLGGPTFDDIGGLEAAVGLGKRLFSGPVPPMVVVLLDEMEKSLVGASGGDLSGVSADALGQLLSDMENEGWDGMINYGIPGGGKTLYAMALAATHNVPLVRFDLGAMKGSLVGQSEERVRGALRTLKGLGGRNVFFVGTCNGLESLPTALRRRFRAGIWMFDSPTEGEKQAIWNINLAKYKLAKPGERPDDTDWTGAEIRNVCELAWRLNCTLREASAYIVPVAKSDPSSLERMRAQAHGHFLSASAPGIYLRPGAAPAPSAEVEKGPRGRTIALDS